MVAPLEVMFTAAGGSIVTGVVELELELGDLLGLADVSPTQPCNTGSVSRDSKSTTLLTLESQPLFCP